MKQFKCHKCGECCKAPGTVSIHDKERRLIAAYMNCSEWSLFQELQMYQSESHISEGIYSIRSYYFPEGCVWYDDDVGCLVYNARPEQCRAWPMRAQEIRNTGICPAYKEYTTEGGEDD